jgi:PAS domain S-box-containing protein
MNGQGIVLHPNTETDLGNPSALPRFHQALAEALHEAKTAEAALQAVIHLMCEYAGWPVGRAQIVQNGSAVPTDVWHLESPRRYKSFVEAVKQEASTESNPLCHRVLKDGKPIWIENFAVEPDSPWLRAAQQAELQSGGAFPVILGNEVFAVLEFYASSPSGGPDEQMQQSLRCVCSQLALIIECRYTIQRALQEKEERYQLLVEQSRDGILLADRDGKILFCNSRGREMLGYSAEEVLGLDIHDTYPPEEVEAAKQRMHDLPHGQTIEFERTLQRKDGRCFPVEVRLHAVKEGWYQGVVRDISERKRAQTAMRQSEAKYRRLIELSPDALYVQVKGHVVLINSAGLRLLGAERPEQILGKHVLDIVHPDSREAVKARMEQLGSVESVPPLEEKYLRLDGSAVDVEVVAATLTYSDQPAVQVIVRDITERKRAMEEMDRDRTLLRALIETIPDRIYAKDTDARFVLNNIAHIRALGAASQDQVKGKTDYDFRPADIASERMADDRKVLESGKPLYNREEATIRADGKEGWNLVNKVPLRDAQGRIVGLVGISRDITERKRMEERLLATHESFQQLAAIVECSDDAIIGKTLDGVITSWNHGAEMIYGYAAHEVVGKPMNFLVPPERSDEVPQILERIRSGEPVKHYETVRIRKDGRNFAVSLTVSPIRDSAGRVVGASSIARDITDRKHMEAKLRLASHYARCLIENNLDPLVTISPDGRITDVNKATELVTGVSRDQLIESDFSGYFTEPQKAKDSYHQAILKGLVRDYPLTIRDVSGRTTDVLLNATAYYNEAGQLQYVFAAARDITERKRVEEETERDRTLLRALIETIPDRIYAKDTDARFILNNAAHLKALGAKTQVETVSKTDFDFRPADVASKCMEDDQQVLQSGQPLSNREEQTKLADGRPGWILVNKVPLRDPDGKIVGLVGISRDITARKEADEKLKTYAEKLERSNRDLQDFAYIASHDLQEPLRKIQAFGDRLKAKYNDALSDTGRDYLARMLDAAGRMQTLINDLLSFSRVTTKAQPFAPVDLDKILREVLSDLEVRIEQTHGRVEAGPLGTIDADALQMRQLFQNLIGNALKFHKQGESPLIRIQGQRTTSGSPAPRIDITFVDNGIGFNQKYADQIFVIFQRLHGRSQYEGTGVGLAVVKKIVERHGGVITAESKEGEGATFRVALPVNHSNGEETT